MLRAFDVEATRAFFAAEGVPLVQEPTGKLFPRSNRARDVLEALLHAARRAGVTLCHPFRVTAIHDHGPAGYEVAGDDRRFGAVILATGGRSVPKTGSDGSGHALACSLGLPLTPRIFPALVPLLLPEGHLVRSLSGLATDVRLTVVSGSGRHLRVVSGALLCTHQGLSGPAVLDASRHWQAALFDDAGTGLLVNWLPDEVPDALDSRLQQLGRRPLRRALAPPLPDRLADALCVLAGVDPDQPGATLGRRPPPAPGRRGDGVARPGGRYPGVRGGRGDGRGRPPRRPDGRSRGARLSRRLRVRRDRRRRRPDRRLQLPVGVGQRHRRRSGRGRARGARAGRTCVTMTRRMGTRRAAGSVLAAVLAALVGSAEPTAQSTSVTPLLWEGHRGTQRIALFGTIHVPDPRVLALPSPVRRAFDASDRVVTEIPLDAGRQAELAALLLLPEGQRLRAIVGEARFARLEQRVRAALAPTAPEVAPLVASMLDRLKPWAAVAQLATLEYLPALLAGRVSLDAQLYADAIAAGKRVGGLETVAEQAGAFDAFSVEEQAALLDEALSDLEEPGQAVTGATLVEWYLAGDGEKLAGALSQGTGDPELARKFQAEVLVKRNHRMADRIEALRRDTPDETVFVAVGALHLVGTENLPQLLEARGYELRRVRP